MSAAQLNLFNTLTRQNEPLRPLKPYHVSLYTCGPTVYQSAHIGNFRSFVYEDLLRRTLHLFGITVQHVINFTDVDDKTIREARLHGVSLRDYTSRHIEEFRRDMEILGIQKQEVQARATDHIPQMIQMIQTLIQRGNAYLSDDHSVYFRVNSFPAYGELAKLDKEGLQAGARVAQDDYVKEAFGDFALWKAWTSDDGEVGWESPWGKGRPGWHIECSAMCQHYLGEEIDIHCGGIDLMFPHHENEIAQCECCTGKKLARSWGHCAHLLVEGEKMSKSTGTIYTVAEVRKRGYTGRELRYALLSTHYRKELNFTWERMNAAKEAVARIDDWRRRWKDLPFHENVILTSESAEFLNEFKGALANDLNISSALGSFFDYLRETNRLMDEDKFRRDLLSVWHVVDSILGLGEESTEISPEVQSLVDQRQTARLEKNWVLSDQLRIQIEALGWLVRDSGSVQEIVRK